MRRRYSVHVDGKGYVLIPAEVGKAMGIAPKSMTILCQEGDEIRLVPAELVPKRRIRKIPLLKISRGFWPNNLRGSHSPFCQVSVSLYAAKA